MSVAVVVVDVVVVGVDVSDDVYSTFFVDVFVYSE